MRFYRTFAALLVVCLLLSLGACGSKSPLSGVYVIKDITDDPDGMTFAEMESMYKELKLDIQDFLRFEFTKEGLFTLTMFGDIEEGSYTRSGNTLTLTFDGGVSGVASKGAAPTSPVTTSTAEISGNKITWTYGSGAKLVFEK